MGRPGRSCLACLALRDKNFFTMTLTETHTGWHQGSGPAVVNWRHRDGGPGRAGGVGTEPPSRGGGVRGRSSAVSAGPGAAGGTEILSQRPSIFTDNSPPKRLVIKNPKHAVHKRSLEILQTIFNFGSR